MRIGLLSPSIYMSPHYKDMIFAPRDLSIALANGLVDRGHEVYFFTAPGIPTKATLVAGDRNLLEMQFLEEKLRDQGGERLKWGSFYMKKRNYELDLTERCYKMALEGKLDIVHSYHDTVAHFFDDLMGFPTIYSLHDPLSDNEHGLSYWLMKKFSHHKYVSISNAFRRNDKLRLNFVQTVYHGINVSKHKTFSGNDKYISLMGRMTKEKGIEFAIEAAKSVNMPIKIATSPMEENRNLSYYRDVIEPHLSSKLISFTGFLGGEDKDKFLGESLCFLFPIQWEEPFGMVMIEAMAVGTPVIAFDRGSVSEVVKDGVTGFVVPPKDGVKGLVSAIKKLQALSPSEYQKMRRSCRVHVEEKFTVEKMVEGYEQVYKKVL